MAEKKNTLDVVYRVTIATLKLPADINIKELEIIEVLRDRLNGTMAIVTKPVTKEEYFGKEEKNTVKVPTRPRLNISKESTETPQVSRWVAIMPSVTILPEGVSITSPLRISYFDLLPDGRTRVIIEKQRDEWEDVTLQCKPIMNKSFKHNGYYIMLEHDGKPVVILGTDGATINGRGARRGYKIEKAEGATYSFRVFKKIE